MSCRSRSICESALQFAGENTPWMILRISLLVVITVAKSLYPRSSSSEQVSGEEDLSCCVVRAFQLLFNTLSSESDDVVFLVRVAKLLTFSKVQFTSEMVSELSPSDVPVTTKHSLKDAVGSKNAQNRA
ncbi:unnamed protein product [Haemonchus placei]|uniref:Secreted protein n=1 Tax=Haemonchus placei TaxID=6290 RepID=A0A0N4WCH4_HAEPC|nr:unnamed protein product [Haemonchus placei]